jgi:hypothetical protein
VAEHLPSKHEAQNLNSKPWGCQKVCQLLISVFQIFYNTEYFTQFSACLYTAFLVVIVSFMVMLSFLDKTVLFLDFFKISCLLFCFDYMCLGMIFFKKISTAWCFVSSAWCSLRLRWADLGAVSLQMYLTYRVEVFIVTSGLLWAQEQFLSFSLHSFFLW